MKPRSTACASCPYRKDAPPGIWHESEYEKLPEYDKETGEQPLRLFLCHTDKDCLCRGWIEVNPDTLALRIGVATGQVSPEDAMPEPCGIAFHKSGAAACKAGKKGIKKPGKRAMTMIRKILRKRKP